MPLKHVLKSTWVESTKNGMQQSDKPWLWHLGQKEIHTKYEKFLSASSSQQSLEVNKIAMRNFSSLFIKVDVKLYIPLHTNKTYTGVLG